MCFTFQSIYIFYKKIKFKRITLLQKFFTSLNPAVIEFFQKNVKERNYKALFIDTINDKFDKKLDEDYSFSKSEIFNEEFDKNDTFDGNNSFYEKKYRSIYDMVEIFLKKCKLINLQYQNNNIIKSNEITNFDGFIREKTIYEYENKVNEEISNEKIKIKYNEIENEDFLEHFSLELKVEYAFNDEEEKEKKEKREEKEEKDKK